MQYNALDGIIGNRKKQKGSFTDHTDGLGGTIKCQFKKPKIL